ncbi:MAG: hypothetical protein EB121_06795 [Alphaproteobacteria bacterium]|nr:hypothetical protein [Alphaproteobacteria bacterium]
MAKSGKKKEKPSGRRKTGPKKTQTLNIRFSVLGVIKEYQAAAAESCDGKENLFGPFPEGSDAPYCIVEPKPRFYLKLDEPVRVELLDGTHLIIDEVMIPLHVLHDGIRKETAELSISFGIGSRAYAEIALSDREIAFVKVVEYTNISKSNAVVPKPVRPDDPVNGGAKVIPFSKPRR